LTETGEWFGDRRFEVEPTLAGDGRCAARQPFS